MLCHAIASCRAVNLNSHASRPFSVPVLLSSLPSLPLTALLNRPPTRQILASYSPEPPIQHRLYLAFRAGPLRNHPSQSLCRALSVLILSTALLAVSPARTFPQGKSVLTTGTQNRTSTCVFPTKEPPLIHLPSPIIITITIIISCSSIDFPPSTSLRLPAETVSFDAISHLDLCNLR